MKKALISILLFSFLAHAGIQYEGVFSENFVIRWAFQDLCDHYFDPRQVWPTPTKGKAVSFDAADVKPGDLIFVRDVDFFFKHKHEKIKVPYFMLTHGEYLDKFEKRYVKYLNDGKILAWFTIHPCGVTHERIIPIPLGMVQYKELYDAKEKTAKRLSDLRKKDKKKLIYMNFTEWRMPFRTKIRKYFETQPYCTKGERCRFDQFIHELAQHKFSVSPPGLGPDCYRVWESLLVGTIPVIEHSVMDEMYEGLPVLFIEGNNWESVTEDFLHNAYERMSAQTYPQEKLSMEYWVKIIDQVRMTYWPSPAPLYKPLLNRFDSHTKG